MKKNNTDVCGIISLIIGITSVFIYFLSILIPLSAIFFGIISIINRKNKIAIVGIILGLLFTFQYINTNYLLPYLQNDVSEEHNKKYSSKFVLKKALKKGFVCENDHCYKDDYSPGKVLINYEINLDEEHIDSSFELDLGNDEFAYVKASYGYNTGIVVCTMYERKNDLLIDYSYNVNTEEKNVILRIFLIVCLICQIPKN